MVWEGGKTLTRIPVGNLLKHICKTEKKKKKKDSISANIVPFIKAFEPNMKRTRDVHIWPARIHIQNTENCAVNRFPIVQTELYMIFF